MPGAHLANETTDGLLLAHGQANHLFHPSLLPGVVNAPGFSTEAAPAAGRRDIDAAMLEALRQAMTVDGGLSGAVRAAAAQHERLDIDAAMLEALRQATIAHHGSRDG
jgi:hypothetical protein